MKNNNISRYENIAIKQEQEKEKEIILTPEEEEIKAKILKALDDLQVEARAYLDKLKENYENVFYCAEVQENAKQKFIKRLEEGDLFIATKIQDIFSLPEEFVLKAANEGLIENLKKGWLDIVIKIKDKFSLPEEIIKDPEVQEAAKKGFIKSLDKFAVYVATKIQDIFSLPEEFVLKAAKKGFIEYLSSGFVYMAIEIQNKFSLPEEIIKDPEVQEAAKKGFIKCLKGDLDTAIEIKDKFSFLEEVIKDPKIQKVIKERFIYTLKKGWIDLSIEIQDKFFLPEEFIKSPEVKKAAEQGFTKNLKEGLIYTATKIQDKFSLPEEFVLKAANEGLIENLKKGWLDIVIEIKDKFSLPEEIIKDPEVQEAAKKGFIENLKYGSVYIATKIKDKFSLPEEFVLKASEEELIKCLKKDWIDTAIEIKDKFSLPEKFVQKAAKEALIDRLKEDWIDTAIEIKDKFSLPEEIIKSPEVQEAAKQVFIKNLKEGFIHLSVKIRNGFSLPEEFIKSPEVQEAAKQAIEGNFNKGSYNHIVEIVKLVPSAKPFYQELIEKQKQIAMDENSSKERREKAIEILSTLSKKDEGLVIEFANILNENVQEKQEKEFGLALNQETALKILDRTNNFESNKVLFDALTNNNFEPELKLSIIEKLLEQDRDFLPDKAKETIKEEWLLSKSADELDWNDMIFVNAIISKNQIPSANLRKKSLTVISKSFNLLMKKGGIAKNWREKYSNIPENTFLQLYSLVNGNEKTMDKFQSLYSSIKRKGRKKNNLLQSIVHALDTKFLPHLIKKLKEIDFSKEEDADYLFKMFNSETFLSEAGRILIDESIEQDIAKILENSHELNKLSNELNNFCAEKLKEILYKKGSDKTQNINPEKTETIIEKWGGDIEPILTYISRISKNNELRKYIAEMFVNFDTEENWKKWRYDLENNKVKKQIGNLSEQQLEIWKNDYLNEMGEIAVSESELDISKKIKDILKDAIVAHKHIFNPEMGQNKNKFIQTVFDEMHKNIDKNPEKEKEIIAQEIKKIQTYSKQIDEIIKFNEPNRIRVKQALETVFRSGNKIKISKKTKNIIDFMSSFLPQDIIKELNENYEKLKNKDSVKTEEILSSNIRKTLEKNIEQIEKNYEDTQNSNVLEELNLDAKNLKQLYKKRRELKSCLDLLLVSSLTPEMIADNKISAESRKKGETINKTMSNLKKYFKNSPLAQDLDNIEFFLGQEANLKENAMDIIAVFTDDPRILWQVGKYPLGCNSCQNYATGAITYVKSLMGYVGDANCKVLYLIKKKDLSETTQKKIKEKGIDSIKNNEVPIQEMLNASVARAVIKIVMDKDNNPVILIEPTYTKVNKADKTMNRNFNLLVKSWLSKPMNIKMAREGGQEQVSRGESRNPEGQYEDTALSQVKFIG